jgi:site-specific recombinase XerD
MKLTPKQTTGKLGFRVTFRHPYKAGQLVCVGLDTRDQNEADAICRDAEAIFKADPAIVDPMSPRLLAYLPKAVAVVFGHAAKEHTDNRRRKPLLDEADIGTLSGRILEAFQIARTTQNIKRLDAVLREFESRRYSELNANFEKVENRNKVVEPLVAELQQQIGILRREANKHVTVTVKDAYSKWKTSGTLATKTQNEITSAIDSFLATLPEGFRLGEVRASHIRSWLDGLRNKKDGTLLSPVTVLKQKRYLSSFLTTMYRDYDLAENPMAKTGTVSGVARNPENIVAVRRLEEIQALLESLKSFPYWRAWVATAILAGPRWAEQKWLKLEDVYLEDGYFRITARNNGERISGTKTGRERSVPIEQTVLKAILKGHVEQRKAEQKKKVASVAEASCWLFPSTVPENKYKPRVLTPAGQWSDNGVFLDAWRFIVEAIKAEQQKAHDKASAKNKKLPEFIFPGYWSYGPMEWRHTFGTVLGHCGWSGLEIARAMGNSAAVAERHYVATGHGGTRWPFKW